MPVTGKLSRKFYEKFGDEVTNELVTWLNAVDDSYRSEFRELFAANFGQVRAEMAQLRAEMRGEMAALRSEMLGEMATLRSEMLGEMAALRSEMRGEIEALRSEMHGEIEALRSEMRGEMAELRAEVRGELSLVRGEMNQLRTELRHDVRSRVAEAEKRLVGWMFKLWLGQVAATIAVILAARAIWH